MALSDSFLQELKYKTDIEDIISTYVTLKKRGSTSVGLCPFHNEKTPSFTVYPNTQSFYCFGCGAGGDAIGFIKKIENLDYIDAVKFLTERAGMQMPQDGFDDSLSKKRRRVLEANRAAAKYFHNYMMSDDGVEGLNYFLSRGLSLSTIKKFGLGFAPDKWDGLLRSLSAQGFSIPDLLDAGLIKKGQRNNYYDFFRNRAMTPIIDVRGNVIAFGGRVLDDSKPKYINSDNTIVYRKTNELFGLNYAKSSGQNSIILCEGYMDVIAMHQAGFTNAVAGCGTALTNEQVRLISRYADEVILAYDADEAGQKAVRKALSLFRNADIKVRVPVLQYGKDPDEIIKNVGVEKFAAMLNGATNEIEFNLEGLKSKYDLSSNQGKIDFANEAVKVLYFATPIEQDLYLSKISEELGIEKAPLKAQLESYKRRVNAKNKRNEFQSIMNERVKDSARISRESGTTSKAVKACERFVYLLIKYPDCIKYLDGFDENCLADSFFKQVYSIAVGNIKNGYDNDLMNFSGKISDDETGRLSGILARGYESSNPKAEFIDCLNILKAEVDKKGKSASEMSDDEFRKLFSNT